MRREPYEKIFRKNKWHMGAKTKTNVPCIERGISRGKGGTRRGGTLSGRVLILATAFSAFQAHVGVCGTGGGGGTSSADLVDGLMVRVGVDRAGRKDELH